MLLKSFVSANEARDRSMLNREVIQHSECDKVDDQIRSAEELLWEQIETAIRDGYTNYGFRLSTINDDSRKFLKVFEMHLIPAIRELGYQVRSDMMCWPEIVIDISWE